MRKVIQLLLMLVMLSGSALPCSVVETRILKVKVVCGKVLVEGLPASQEPLELQRGFDKRGEIVATQNSGQDGGFHFGTVEAGEYRLIARRSNQLSVRLRVKKSSPIGACKHPIILDINLSCGGKVKY